MQSESGSTGTNREAGVGALGAKHLASTLFSQLYPRWDVSFLRAGKVTMIFILCISSMAIFMPYTSIILQYALLKVLCI